MAQTVILNGQSSRIKAAELCRVAPQGSVCKISAPRRTIPQNDKLWALLSELSRAKPEGRDYPPEVWKCLVMAEAGHQPIWERSLDGRGVIPVGFKSSRLTKAEFSDVIEAIYAYGAEHGVEFNRDGEPETGVKEETLANNHSPSISQ